MNEKLLTARRLIGEVLMTIGFTDPRNKELEEILASLEDFIIQQKHDKH